MRKRLRDGVMERISSVLREGLRGKYGYEKGRVVLDERIDWEKFHSIEQGLGFTLTEEQRDFILKFISGEGHFTLLGEGGSGKSTVMWVLKLYYGEEIVFGGSSGIATVNLPNDIGVATGHSLFNLAIGEAIESDYKKRAHEVLSSSELIKIVCLDEAYCYNSQDLDMMLNQITRLNKRTRKRKQRNIRLLLVGDCLQRLPIVDKELRPILKDRFGHWLMFRSSVWEKANFTTYVFQEVKRQTGSEPKDIWFKKALYILRYGIEQHYDKLIEGFNRKCVGDNHSEDAVYIAPTNAMVNNYNDLYLSRNPNLKMTFEVEFDKKYTKKNFPMDWEVTVAQGCKVITLVNNPDAGFQNGTVLTLTNVSRDGVYGVKESGEEVFVPIHEFKEDEVYVAEEVKDGSRIQVQKRRHVASAYMLPVKLCAGFVSARVQGRTFNQEGLIDFGSDRQDWLYTKKGMEDFMVAGAYVNFGRFTNIDHVKLKHPMKKIHIKCCRDSINFWWDCVNKMKGGIK